MTHPNEEVARQEMEAALRGDLEGMLAHYTDDVVLHYPGRNKLSGTYRGINAIREWVDMISELIGPGGSFTRSLHDILASDDHAVQLVSVDARMTSGPDRQLECGYCHASPRGKDLRDVGSS